MQREAPQQRRPGAGIGGRGGCMVGASASPVGSAKFGPHVGAKVSPGLVGAGVGAAHGQNRVWCFKCPMSTLACHAHARPSAVRGLSCAAVRRAAPPTSADETTGPPIYILSTYTYIHTFI
jgi:hypothetical protein